jgi:hypothetical protein
MSGSGSPRRRSTRRKAIAFSKTRTGAAIHLTRTVPGWLIPERNPFGVYDYSPQVDAIAARFGGEAEVKPWGLRELALSDPNGTLVRIGWPKEQEQPA